MISRRDALKLGAAGLASLSAAGLISPTEAKVNDPEIWNYHPNSEMPGPRLDVEGSIGELWRFQADQGATPVALLNGILYVFERSNPASHWNYSIGVLIAIDMATGNERWRVAAPGKESSDRGLSTPSASEEQENFRGSLAIAHSIVYVPLTNGRLWGVSAETGELMWEIPWASTEPPFFVGDLGYWVNDDRFVAGRLETEVEEVWSANIEPRQLVGIQPVDDLLIIVTWDEIRALRQSDGSEYWRVQYHDMEPFFYSGDHTANMQHRWGSGSIDVFSSAGEQLWQQDSPLETFHNNWFTGISVTRLSYYDGYEKQYWFENFDLASGSPLWFLAGSIGTWDYQSVDTLLCDGSIIGSLANFEFDRRSDLLMVDPERPTLHIIPGFNLGPKLMTGGVLFAHDPSTDEIVAIGPIPPVLKVGGRAMTNDHVILRGGPNDTSIERSQLETGTIVWITGDEEAGWLPVTVEVSEQSGWLQVNHVDGLAGDFDLIPIDVREFGTFTDYRT